MRETMARSLFYKGKVTEHSRVKKVPDTTSDMCAGDITAQSL